MAKGFTHEAPNEGATNVWLTMEKNQSAIDKALLGKFAFQVFSDRDAGKLYVRLYHFDTRQAAWYDVSEVDEGSAPYSDQSNTESE